MLGIVGIIALACLMLTSLISCSYLSIPAKDDVASKRINPKGDNNAPVYNSAVIKGRITGADKGKVSTLIIAHRLADVSGEWAEYLAVNNSGTFMLYLPQGRYQLYTIADHNHNGIYENDEISGACESFFSPKEISIRENELITDVVIRTARPNGNKTNFSLESALKKETGYCQANHA